MSFHQVMATKVYTSAEFKRERDNFLSLIKNMEKTDTKKWLDEVKETLFRHDCPFWKCILMPFLSSKLTEPNSNDMVHVQGPCRGREEG